MKQVVFSWILVVAACSSGQAPEPPAGVPAASTVSFVNKVWEVSQSSSVAPGTLYVFLSDGTLVITSQKSRPSLGTWKQAAGLLTMVEEGISYRVNVVKLTADEFVIISNNPGRAVEITLVPAPSSPAPK
jgi:hypothetical protein